MSSARFFGRAPDGEPRMAVQWPGASFHLEDDQEGYCFTPMTVKDEAGQPGGIATYTPDRRITMLTLDDLLALQDSVNWAVKHKRMMDGEDVDPDE